MPFRKKILYYGLMLGLTLLALEGMARIAYYAAYGQGYGGGGPDAPADYSADPYNPGSPQQLERWRIAHPFYGYADPSPANALNAMPPRPREQDQVVVALLGGSVAKQVKPFLQTALNRYFAANQLPRPAVVRSWAMHGARQPQQTLIVAHTLLLGGEFDLIVNLDGFNEMAGSTGHNFGGGSGGNFPFFPLWWHKGVGLTAEEIILAGRIGVLRREQARQVAAGATSPLRRSALFGLANRWRQDRIAAEIIRLNRQLAALTPAYSMEKHGRRNWPEQDALFSETARVWYRSSLMLARLANLAGAEYYHFLQPNQYAPGSKPLSREERELAYAALSGDKFAVERGYPQLRAFHRDLQRQGVNYFDLTGIFADHPETLYIDECCHLNDRGYELLAAAMLRRLEPALQGLSGARPEAAVSGLAATRRHRRATAATPDFQVSVADDGKQLRYVRADCAPEDTEPWFFLTIVPEEVTDLPPGRQPYGFDRRFFSFAESGGRFERWQCAAQTPLPDYPIKEIHTGQSAPGQGQLWAVKLIVPPDPDQLRAAYAALAAANPAARAFFDLYELDNRLLYLRESCVAADTAAGFFLHIIPADITDLPQERRAAGFAHGGFAFAQQGGHFDGKCLAAVPLPEYPIKEMRTGQHIPGQGDLWTVRLIAAPDLDQLRADYTALSAAEPAARDYFDLYLRGNRLLYLRETCASADTAANFFLHIVPADVTDLPAERRAAGFAHGGFEFVRRGRPFDGKCLAAVPLPEYPIKEMRTGQHIPGQGDLWSAVIAGP